MFRRNAVITQVVVRTLLGAVVGALLLGAIAFLLAGPAGVINGLLFGAAGGLIVGALVGVQMTEAIFWGDIAQKYGEDRQHASERDHQRRKG